MNKPADPKPDAREPYQPPTLTEYGTVRELTRTTNLANAMNDMFGNQKT